MWDFSCSIWDLIPWLGMEPRPSALGVQSPTHWTTREILMHVFMLSHSSRVWLFLTLWTVICQAPLSMGFSRQEIPEWVVSRGSSPRRDPTHVCFPCWQEGSLPLAPPGKPMETAWRFLKEGKWKRNYNSPVDLKNIHNLKVESYVLFSRNF